MFKKNYVFSYFMFLFIVSEEDKTLQSPFTQAPTASLIIERQRQAKERAPPPGSSKLRKYREHSEPSANKVSHCLFLNFDSLHCVQYLSLCTGSLTSGHFNIIFNLDSSSTFR